MELTAENVMRVLSDSFFTDEELKDHPAGREDAVIAYGVVLHAGFHPQRLESHREDVRSMLAHLPKGFFKDSGGGWSFLGACNRADGIQWGEHRDMDALFTLGIALGFVRFCFGREMWEVLPGQMPYIVIDLNNRKSHET